MENAQEQLRQAEYSKLHAIVRKASQPTPARWRRCSTACGRSIEDAYTALCFWSCNRRYARQTGPTTHFNYNIPETFGHIGVLNRLLFHRKCACANLQWKRTPESNERYRRKGTHCPTRQLESRFLRPTEKFFSGLLQERGAQDFQILQA